MLSNFSKSVRNIVVGPSQVTDSFFLVTMLYSNLKAVWMVIQHYSVDCLQSQKDLLLPIESLLMEGQLYSYFSFQRILVIGV
jgi:hypothetical protein